MSVIAALRVVMGIETAAYETGLRRAQQRTRAANLSITSSFATMSRSIAPLVGGMAALFGVAMIRRALATASSIAEVGQQLGVTTRDLQIYRYAASQVGVSQEEMDRGLQRLTRSLGQAREKGSALASLFDRLGISIRDANGRIKTAGEVMPQLAQAIARLPDAATRGTVLFQLFGRAGQQLAPLFAEGARGIEQFTRRAEELGLVLSDSEIANADRTADKIDELSRALSTNFSRVVAQNADSILALANNLGQLAVRVTQFLASDPQTAFAIMGAMLGGRFGLPGAGAGAVGGFILGDRVGAAGDDANMDLNFRRRALQGSFQELQARRAAASSGSLISVRQGNNPHGRSGATVESAHAEFLRQSQLAHRAAAAARAGAVPHAPALTPLDIGSAGGGGGGGSNAAERERKEALRRDHEFETARRRTQIDLLQEQQQQATEATTRSTLQRQILDIENQQFAADERLAVALGDTTRARADILIQDHAQLDAAKRVTIDEEQYADDVRSRAEAQREDNARHLERLQQEADLADTVAERRAAELAILDETLRYERIRLNEIINNRQTSPGDLRDAQHRLDGLDASAANQRASILRNTRSPLEEFLSQLPTTAARANEALQHIAVNGLQSLTDGLVEAMMQAKSLGDVFKNVAKSIIADLLRIQIQRAIIGPLSSALSGLMGGIGGGGGSFNFLAAATKLAPGAFATGGSIRVGGMAGVDRNLLSLNGNPVARVSMGETIDVTPANRRGGGDVYVTQHFSPNFAGNAATKQEMIQLASMVKPMAQQAFQDFVRRRG